MSSDSGPEVPRKRQGLCSRGHRSHEGAEPRRCLKVHCSELPSSTRSLLLELSLGGRARTGQVRTGGSDTPGRGEGGERCIGQRWPRLMQREACGSPSELARTRSDVGLYTAE